MQIYDIRIEGEAVLLQEASGSEVRLTLDDAINLFIWLRHHMPEIEKRSLEQHLRTSNPDDYLHEG